MEDDAESGCEMRSLSSGDDVILDKQNKASAMEDNNSGYITKIGTDGNIEKVSRPREMCLFSLHDFL